MATAAALVLCGVVWLSAAVGAAAQSSDETSPPTGAVVGHVLDGSGNPLGGAQLILVDLLDVNAIAADDGSYVIGGVVAGDHVLIGQINEFIGDPISVSVPANDAVVVDVVLAPPPAATPTPTPVPDVPTPTTTPVPDVPTATPTPVPDAPTPTSTPNPAARVVSLSGTVRDDQGAAPPTGTRVQLFDLPFVTTSVGGDGAFTLSGIPAGTTHLVYASAPQKTPSDVQVVSFGSDPVAGFTLSLKPFAGGGNPTEFSGRVVFSGGGSGVGSATVWRLGAAGVTSSASNGTFVLVDATRSAPDSDSSVGRAPDKVTLVAAKDDRWGFANINSSNPPAPMIIALNQQGKPPAPPRTYNWQSTFAADQGQFFTARWKTGPHKDLGIRLMLANKTVVNPGGNGIGQCVGDCSGVSTAGLVVALPRGQSFTIQAWNEAIGSDGAAEPTPDWDEAQVVSGSST